MLKSLILLFVHLISLCCPVFFQARPIDSLNRTSIYNFKSHDICCIGYWGEPERAPHLSYCCAKSSLYIYIYTCRSSVRPASNLVPRRAPLNAQRANVGRASNDSKVNNIALKTATLVSRFSWRSSLPTEQLV